MSFYKNITFFTTFTISSLKLISSYITKRTILKVIIVRYLNLLTIQISRNCGATILIIKSILTTLSIRFIKVNWTSLASAISIHYTAIWKVILTYSCSLGEIFAKTTLWEIFIIILTCTMYALILSQNFIIDHFSTSVVP